MGCVWAGACANETPPPPSSTRMQQPGSQSKKRKRCDHTRCFPPLAGKASRVHPRLYAKYPRSDSREGCLLFVWCLGCQPIDRASHSALAGEPATSIFTLFAASSGIQIPIHAVYYKPNMGDVVTTNRHGAMVQRPMRLVLFLLSELGLFTVCYQNCWL